MKIKITILALLSLTTMAHGQVTEKIAIKLDSMVKEDQKWRGLIRQLHNQEIDSIDLNTVNKHLSLTDSLNYEVILGIFNNYGFLGTAEVGKVGAHNFWLLVQHQDKHPDFQLRVLDEMESHAARGNMSYLDYAYLIDRVNVNTGQPQVYGTQMMLNADTTSFTPKLVIDIENLNERRRHAGLSTIEEYIEIMNSRYYGDLKK